ncbi:MAG: NAD(P)-binding domain-containing protein [Planctomycetota bacterium]
MNGDSPDTPLDVLVVGAGPCGTAAAWRAHELGLSVLIIDRDSVLSIVKEWGEHQPEPKDVDADYGDLVDLIFPAGGPLVSQLPYEDQTPADQLYSRWMKVYDDNQVPYRNGVELGGCERLPNGVLAAEVMELNTQAKTRVYCKNLVLALGSGSPAKVRVMGDGLGIRYKLGDANEYVGAPACVVGGGMSAAEAVVAIAMAKAKAKDDSDIFWCYRGRGMPKVAQGKALASKFYEAWTGGNIRYLPLSEPLAVFKDDKGKDLVAVKTRRLQQPNQPPELLCYEFEKKQVLAFIGSERPTELLGSMGIQEFELADAPKKKRLAVTALKETQEHNIFMAGGLLHPAYLQTNDFRPEALQSTLKEYSTCFKLAMIEGVSIIETIKKRLDGGSDEQIAKALAQQSRTMIQPVEKPAPAPAPVEAAPEPSFGAAFVHIGPGENPQKEEYFFPVGDSIVGRTGGRVVIGNDTLLKEQHAAFRIDGDECYVTNAEQGGECYVRVNSERTLAVGQVLVAGRQRLRVDDAGGKLVLSRLDAAGGVLKTIPVTREERAIGRDELDSRDFALSRSHLAVADAGGLLRVRDESRNGTFIELRGSLRLNEGDEVWMGEQRFRYVEMRSEMLATGTVQLKRMPSPTAAPAAAAPAAPAASPAPAPAPAAPAAAAAPAPAPAPAPAAPAPAAEPAPAAVAASGPPTIILEDGTEFAAAEEMPMLSYMADAGIATNEEGGIDGSCQTLWECWDQDDPTDTGGTCGKCVVVVLEGMANLSEASSREKNTIKKKAKKKLGDKVDEAACRLPCQAYCKGPVKIQPKGK